MHVGEWTLFENTGASTAAAASTFKGFHRLMIHYVTLGPTWQLTRGANMATHTQVQGHDFLLEGEEQDGSPLLYPVLPLGEWDEVG